MNHLTYDAFNGSLLEQDLIHDIGNEKPPCEAIKQMSIDHIRPQEVQATEIEDPQVATTPKPEVQATEMEDLILYSTRSLPVCCRGSEIKSVQIKYIVGDPLNRKYHASFPLN